jgi:sterol desaturase/sphingolipid hydroxylase (fatty acid hydroxylase superfamily)
MNELISKSIPAAALLVVGALEVWGGLYFDSKRTKNDIKIELVSLLTLPTLVQPSIFVFIFFLGNLWFPQYENLLAAYPFWVHFIAFLVFDDLTQYWWHRLSHSNKFMWKLHRPHHVIPEMGVLVTYRNAFLYYAFMPGIWLSAILIFLGMGYVYLFYLPIKLVVIILAHSETKWDRFLYQHKILSPLAWVIERLISTPSTHFAHHGLTVEDGISHPNGNYGNLLFLWDVLFGTAKITRKYPTEFGAWNKIKEPWYVQLFFPILRSKNPKSELYSIKNHKDYNPNIDAAKFDE